MTTTRPHWRVTGKPLDIVGIHPGSQPRGVLPPRQAAVMT